MALYIIVTNFSLIRYINLKAVIRFKEEQGSRETGGVNFHACYAQLYIVSSVDKAFFAILVRHKLQS